MRSVLSGRMPEYIIAKKKAAPKRGPEIQWTDTSADLAEAFENAEEKYPMNHN